MSGSGSVGDSTCSAFDGGRREDLSVSASEQADRTGAAEDGRTEGRILSQTRQNSGTKRHEKGAEKAAGIGATIRSRHSGPGQSVNVNIPEAWSQRSKTARPGSLAASERHAPGISDASVASWQGFYFASLWRLQNHVPKQMQIS
jgi:hypothetical protein